MSILAVNYGMEGSFRREIKNAKRELNKRIDDYESIANRVSHIPSSTNNCYNCAYYVRKKEQHLRDKVGTLISFDKTVEQFIDNVRNVDRGVASSIKSDTGLFRKRTGIGKYSKSIWASICEGLGDCFEWYGECSSDFWKGVKQFYEDNKYWINIVVDIVALVGAISILAASGGLVGFAIALFSVANQVFDLTYDAAAAYHHYHYHDDVEAERLAAKGAKDFYMAIGKNLDEKWGTDCMEVIMGNFYTLMKIAEFGYGMYKVGAAFLKDLRLDKIHVKSLFNGKAKLSTHLKYLPKAIRNAFGFRKVQQKDVMKLAYSKLFKFVPNKHFKIVPKIAEVVLGTKILIKGINKTWKRIKKFNKYRQAWRHPVDLFTTP